MIPDGSGVYGNLTIAGNGTNIATLISVSPVAHWFLLASINEEGKRKKKEERKHGF